MPNLGTYPKLSHLDKLSILADSGKVMRNPTLVTLIYCVRDAHVLLARRVHEPYVGYWIAPGGKIKAGESPREAASRELKEETGLIADELQLRAVISETSPRDDHQWLLFIYRTEVVDGVVRSDEREGPLVWHQIADLDQLPQPEPDKCFTPHVLGHDPGVYEAHFELDDNLNIVTQTQTTHV